MAPRRAEYQYRPLETKTSIRLIEVRGSPKQPRYRLIYTTIESAPPYQTLSYHWGKDHHKQYLDLFDGTRFRITKTLQALLPEVHDFVTTGYLWIDQMCIHQDNGPEKSQQLKIMGDIYRDSESVIVWLGINRNRNIDWASDLFGWDEPDSRSIVSARSAGISLDSIEELVKKVGSCYDFKYTYKGFIDSVLAATWFERGWVYQEIVLPPRSTFLMPVNMGGTPTLKTMSLEDLYLMCQIYIDATYLLTGRTEVFDPQVYRMYQHWTKRHARGKHGDEPLEQIMSAVCPGAKVTQDLDQLYAFYGLNLEAWIDLQPVQGIKMPAALTSLAMSIIQGTHTLEIFEVVARCSTFKKKVPSWVPDFRQRALANPFVKTIASGPLSPVTRPMYRWRGKCDGTMLRVQGKRIDTIGAEVGSIGGLRLGLGLPDGTDSRVFSLCNKAWKSNEDLSRRNSVGPLTQDRVFYRTLLALFAESHCERVTFTPAQVSDILYLIESRMVAWLRKYPQTSKWASHGEWDPRFDNLPEYRDGSIEFGEGDERFENVREAKNEMMRSIEKTMVGRQLFTTKAGLFAVGSDLSKGDIICVLNGCSNPVALREKKKGVYTVQGTCYLEGWMDPWSSGKVTWGEFEGEEFVIV